MSDPTSVAHSRNHDSELPAVLGSMQGRDALPPEIAQLLDRPVAAADVIADRRGARVWQVVLDDRRVLAVKYTQTDPTDSAGIRPRAAELAAREAAVLRVLPDDVGYLYAAGYTGQGSWLAVHWINKPSLSQLWQRTRATGRRARDAKQVILAVASAAANALHRLHRQGWVHGDLQADHLLYSHGRVKLIDFAWAHGPALIEPDVPYRGGLADVTAPEIAEQLWQTSATHHVTLDPAAEVYTLSAVLYSTWSQQPIRDPETGSGDPSSLPAVYRRICDEASLAPIDFHGWRAMEHLFREMLAQQPGDRPTIGEVRERLVWLSERTPPGTQQEKAPLPR